MLEVTSGEVVLLLLFIVLLLLFSIISAQPDIFSRDYTLLLRFVVLAASSDLKIAVGCNLKLCCLIFIFFNKLV
jgi:hypothetical protein